MFSYQRSAGFLQQNLQTGPSFVDRSHYPRPYEDDEDDSDQEEQLDVAEQERRWRERLDQEERVGKRTAHDQANAGAGAKAPDYGEPNTDSDSGGPPSGLLVDTDYAATTETGSSATDSHTMPPNTRYNAPRNHVHGHGKLDAAQVGELSERSPLLLERTRTRNGSSGGGGADGGPSSSFLSVKSASGFHERDHARRASVFSREAWKAKIEEHRGESTWGQTLFNTYAGSLASFR